MKIAIYMRRLSNTVAMFLIAGPASAQLTTNGLGLDFDANRDLDGNSNWESQASNQSRNWTLGTNVTRTNAAPGTAFEAGLPGLTAAYDFPTSGTDVAADKASALDYENFNESASTTWEFWIRANDNATDQVIWESGGATDGSSLVIRNTGNYRFTLKDGNANLVQEFAVPDTTGYHHIVGVFTFNPVDSNSTFTIYVDGVTQGVPATATAVADWVGADDSGLGGMGQSAVGGSGAGGVNLNTFGTLDGQVAAFRFYEATALSEAEVRANYGAVTSAVVQLSQTAGWETDAAWSTALRPTWAQSVVIAGGSTATVSSAGAVAKDLTLGGTGDGTLVVSGGSLTIYGDIVSGAAGSGVTLSGGALNLEGHALGTGGSPIDTLAFESGMLQNVGSINGAAGLTKSGAWDSVLILDGTNAWSGGTVVESGALVAAVTSALPGWAASGNVVVSNGAAIVVRTGGAGEWTTGEFDAMLAQATLAPAAGIGLEVLGGNTQTYSTAVSGGLGFVKLGDGLLKLDGANTHAGGTIVGAGTLELGDVDALGGGPLQLGGRLFVDGVSAHTITNLLVLTGNVAFGDPVNNGSLTFSGSVDFAGGTRSITTDTDVLWTGISTNGGLNQKLGQGTFRIQGDGNWSGAIEIREGIFILDGVTVTNGDALRVMAINAGETARYVLTNGASVFIDSATSNLRVGYGGGSTAGTNITDIAGTLIFRTGAGGGNVQIGTSSAKGIVNLLAGGAIETCAVQGMSGGESEFNFDGGTLRALQNATGFMQGLTSAFVRAGGAIVDSGGFNITIAQNLLDGGGGGGFTKNGSGTLTLTGSNTFTGAVTLNAGNLLISSANALGTSGGLVAIPSGAGFGPTYAIDQAVLGLVDPASAGTVVLGADSANDLDFAAAGLTNASLGAAAGVTATNAGVLTPYGTTYRLGGGEGTLVYTGKLTGARGLVVGGGGSGGTVVLPEDNDYTGPTLISTGTLQIGIGGTTGTLGAGALTNNGTLRLFRSDAVAFSKDIVGNGTLNVLGTGAYSLTGDNTFSGGSELGNANANGNGRPVIRLGGDSDLGTGPVRVRGAQITSDGSTDRVLSNAFTVADGGGMALILGDTSTYTGSITFLGDGNFDNANRSVEANSTGVFANAMSDGPGAGAGSITKLGNGVLILRGANTFTGGFTINAGTLVADCTNTFTAGVNLSGGTLEVPVDAGMGDMSSLLTFNNGTLHVTGSFTNERSFAFTDAKAATIAVDAAQTMLLGGRLGGGSTSLDGNNTTIFTKTGRGMLILTNTSVYPAQTVVGQGALVYEGVGGHQENAGAASGFYVGGLTGDDGMLIIRGDAVLDLDNGTQNYEFTIGRDAASTGTVYVQDNAWIGLHLFTVGGGSNALGTVIQSGGVVRKDRNTTWQIGGATANDSTAVGRYHLYGGAVTANQVQVGSYGSGEMIVTGGNINVQAWFGVGRYPGSTGSVTVSGSGLVNHTTANAVMIGEQGLGTVLVTNGGTLRAASTGMMIGGNGGANQGDGTVTLGAGGTIETVGVLPGGGPSAFHFDGGTLRALGSSAAFMTGLTGATVRAGGAVIDTAAYTLTIGQALLDGGGNGGLTKLGSGTLTLSGNGTYTGPTAVSNGTLKVDGTHSGGGLITVHSGATLMGGGSVGGITVRNGGTLSPGASPGTLTAGGAVTLESGATFQVELHGLTAGTEYDQLAMGGNTLALTSPELAVTLGFTPVPGDSFLIITGLSGYDPGTFGTFNGKPQGAQFTVSSTTFEIDYGTSDITLTVVPEPASLGVVGLLAAAVLLRRRRV